MGNHVNLLLGFHSHQPVGNFDHVFEENYRKAYWPFLEKLERHPQIRVSLHYTGILYQWLNAHHPELNDLLRVMVRRGQIEMMTGGYYEPILSVIPDEDKQGQLRKLTDYIKECTGYEATGSWLAERVWEPHLASHFAKAGIRYTITDDSHFRSAGLQENETWGYYLTEDSGKTLAIFPINERMRYLIPFEPIQKTIELLKEVAAQGGTPTVIMADDGEKFGGWPGTFEHCYQKGWVEDFFKVLEDNLDWVRLMTFNECLNTVKPLGRIYLPTASYAEMMEWAMPTPAILKYENFVNYLKAQNQYEMNKPYVRGGFWRNFLAKYPESNNIHKKMLRVSHKVNQLIRDAKALGLSPEFIKKMKDYLYAGQTNCGYWHGIFGGLYLNYLRSALYRNLLNAENMVDKAVHGDAPWIEIEETDFDNDGEKEILISAKKMNCYFRPGTGGALFEEDIKPIPFNLLDTLSRKPESYHEKLRQGHVVVGDIPVKDDGAVSIHDMVRAKEPGLEKHLHYDSHLRHTYIDHFFAPSTTLEEFRNNQYKEIGDFTIHPYSSRYRQEDGMAIVEMVRTGALYPDTIPAQFTVKKTFTMEADDFKTVMAYQLTNQSSSTLRFCFGVEFNLAMLAGYAEDRYYHAPGTGIEIKPRNLASVGELQHLTEIGAKDQWTGIDYRIQFPVPAKVWRFPIETVSLSEAGFEKVYQSSVILPHWEIELKPETSWKITFIRNILLSA
jgi:alpha-amylase